MILDVTSLLYGLSRRGEHHPAESKSAVYASSTTPALVLIIRAVRAILRPEISAHFNRVPATGLTSELRQENLDVRPFFLAHETRPNASS